MSRDNILAACGTILAVTWMAVFKSLEVPLSVALILAVIYSKFKR